MIISHKQKEILGEMRDNVWYDFKTGRLCLFFDELERLGFVEKRAKKVDSITICGYRKINSEGKEQ